MLLSEVQLHEASTLEQASALLAQYSPDVRVMAGGTDLLVDLKTSRFSVSHLVAIHAIAGLQGVAANDKYVSIGALTSPNQLAAAAEIRQRFPAILDAAGTMAAPQIRNMGSVGGNLAGAVPSADLPPILIVLNASVRLWSQAGIRELPLDSFFSGPRQTVCRHDEILTEVHLPIPPPRFGAAYARFALREANACAVAAVAASLAFDEHQIIRQARVCIGAVAPTPKLVRSAAVALIGHPADDRAMQQAAEAAMAESRPIDDIRASAEYRRELVGILTRRALLRARQRAQEAK